MNPQQPDEPIKIEYGQEQVATPNQAYGYEPTKDAAKLTAMAVTQNERLGLAIISLVMSLGLPIVVGLLWSAFAANGTDPTQGFGGMAIGALALFLILIFVIPLTTLFSWLTAYVAIKKSKKAGRWVAIGSLVISGIGLVMLVLFINSLSTATGA